MIGFKVGSQGWTTMLGSMVLSLSLVPYLGPNIGPQRCVPSLGSNGLVQQFFVELLSVVWETSILNGDNGLQDSYSLRHY